MASGHVNRTQRPNTWLHRPSLRREDSPCQLGAVHTWPIPLNKSGSKSSWNARAREERWTAAALLSGWLEVRHRYQFRQLPEVLGGGCQEELIAGTVSEPV